MNILGLFVIEIIGAGLFSLAFFGGFQKVKGLCYSSLARLYSYIHIAIIEAPETRKENQVLHFFVL